MSNGGVIGRRNVPGVDGTSGVWPLREIADARRLGIFPDPYRANVVALLHMDGADGSTTFTDVRGHVFTPTGNVQIDTAQSKFGGASGLFDGSGDYITTPSSSDFAYGAGDFTLECWVRLASLAGNQYILDHNTNLGAILYNGGLRFYNTTTGTGSPLYTTAAPLVVNTWYHIAYSRQGGTGRLFLDGSLTASGTDGQNYPNLSLRIGDSGNPVAPYNGHIDEVRITKGVGRYTANFTPPATPFPDP